MPLLPALLQAPRDRETLGCLRARGKYFATTATREPLE
jgi:hypothetical protein